MLILRKPLLIIMTKWPGYGRGKTRLSADIGKYNSLKIHKHMFCHTLSVAKYLEKKNILEISLAITGIGPKKSRKWCNDIGIKDFNLQGSGSLGEKMKRQILINLKRQPRKIIIIGTDLPDLCHLDLIKAISTLDYKDAILGPSNDGGYWIIGLSDKLLSRNFVSPFINIKWSSDDVFQRTIDNFNLQKISADYLLSKVDIDTISDIKRRK